MVVGGGGGFCGGELLAMGGVKGVRYKSILPLLAEKRENNTHKRLRCIVEGGTAGWLIRLEITSSCWLGWGADWASEVCHISWKYK